MTTPAFGLRPLLTLAWPIILARATQSVIGFSDALMVAPLGEESLAAVTTGSFNTFTFIILPMGTAFILQSFAAQLRGRGDLLAIPRYGWYGLGLAAIAALIALVVTPIIPRLVGTLGYAATVEALMSSYLSIRLLSVGAAVGMEALGNWYGGLGNTRPSLVAGLTAMISNVALNYVLILPRFGLPGYGVAGSAWASMIASWLGFAVLLFGFLRGRGYDKPRVPLAQLGLKWSELRRVLKFGLPNGINWFLEFGAFALFLNLIVGHLGTTALAAFNVVIQINSVSFMPAFGVASAGAIMVGEAIGRRAHDEVTAIVKLTCKVAATWMGSVGLLYVAFPSFILGWFHPANADSHALIETGASMLILSAIWQLFDAANMTLSEALRAAGDTTWCMGARLIVAWLVFVPLAWTAVFVFEGGVNSVMAAMVIYLALLALAFAFRFASGKWRNIDLVGEPVVI